jgi:curved DNA-binding protein CbpA
VNTRFKTIEEMNYYEILNIRPSASQQEIEEAYGVAKNAFAQGSLANYGLVEGNQRQKTLEKVEEAYKILSHPRRRKKYDVKTPGLKSEAYENAYFRNSTERILIEEAEPKPSLADRIRRFFRKA